MSRPWGVALALALLAGCEPAIKSAAGDGGGGGGELDLNGAPPADLHGQPAPPDLRGDGPIVDEGPTRYPHDAVASPITEGVKQRVRAIAAADAQRLPNVFMKVGASGTVSTNLLFCFAGASQPQYTLALDGRDALQPTIDHFRAGMIGPASDSSTPFDRVTLAAKVGRTASWAITGNPSPLEQEIAASNARFAFVNYGTNDMGGAGTYQAALFPFYDKLGELLDTLEQGGIVPIVSGLNPRGDSAAAALLVPTWDVVTRAIAEERQLPYVSLYRLTWPLPKQGLLGDGLHGNVWLDGNGKVQPCVFDATALQFNYNARNLASIAALDATKRAVVDDAAPPSVPALPGVAGAGTAADPFVIDALPFSHAFTTVGGESLVDAYAACGANQNEAGPEITYRLQLTTATPLRVLVFDRGEVDVDVHLLTGADCQERNDRLVERTVPAGDHRLVVDTFVSGTTAHSGRYLLVVVPCETGDASCQ